MSVQQTTITTFDTDDYTSVTLSDGNNEQRVNIDFDGASYDALDYNSTDTRAHALLTIISHAHAALHMLPQADDDDDRDRDIANLFESIEIARVELASSLRREQLAR